jgi:hypothetical protein
MACTLKYARYDALRTALPSTLKPSELRIPYPAIAQFEVCMPDVATVHQDGSTYRQIDQGAVTYEFEIVGDDESDLAAYEYQGDDDAPDDAIEGLRDWIDEYHDEVRDSRNE